VGSSDLVFFFFDKLKGRHTIINEVKRNEGQGESNYVVQ